MALEEPFHKLELMGELFSGRPYLDNVHILLAFHQVTSISRLQYIALRLATDNLLIPEIDDQYINQSLSLIYLRLMYHLQVEASTYPKIPSQANHQLVLMMIMLRQSWGLKLNKQ